MPSKNVLQKYTKAVEVEGAARRNQPAATEALRERVPQPIPDPPTEAELANGLREVLSVTEAPPPVDWNNLQDNMSWEIRVARERLLEADHLRERSIHDLPLLRERRDDAVQAAYDQLVRVRQVLRAVLGEKRALKVLGVDGKTPTQPDHLLIRLHESAERLRRPSLDNAELRMPGMTQSWDELADGLDAVAAPLEEAIVAVRDGNKDADVALVARGKVEKEFQDLMVGFTNVLEGLYIAGGVRGLASRLRPSTPGASNDDGADPDIVVVPDVPDDTPDLPDEPDESDPNGSEDPGGPGPVLPPQFQRGKLEPVPVVAMVPPDDE